MSGRQGVGVSKLSVTFLPLLGIPTQDIDRCHHFEGGLGVITSIPTLAFVGVITSILIQYQNETRLLNLVLRDLGQFQRPFLPGARRSGCLVEILFMVRHRQFHSGFCLRDGLDLLPLICRRAIVRR